MEGGPLRVVCELPNSPEFKSLRADLEYDLGLAAAVLQPRHGVARFDRTVGAAEIDAR